MFGGLEEPQKTGKPIFDNNDADTWDSVFGTRGGISPGYYRKYEKD